ncbi:MAG TPA: phosphate-starvation-inducible PsiE family protein [Thermoanaerobaculia bacterium]
MTSVSKERSPASRRDARGWISSQFTRVEDVVYIGLGLLLAASALVLLVAAAIRFGQSLLTGQFPASSIDLLDRLLLILMIVELLYTVQVSFREHTLVPEPFLIVGLIAATRRILVLTAEFVTLLEKGEGVFRNAMIELALLTLLIVAMVFSLVLLRRRRADAVADRA